jgi:hypothetical protein
MRPARNQIIERHYFERFREAYSLPTGQLGYGDKPDVTLTGDRTIGIEVTRFYLQPGSRLESKQRQRPLRDAVVEQAQALYRAQGGKAVELHISFDTPTGITPRRTGKLISQNITVSCLRSATAGIRTVAGGALRAECRDCVEQPPTVPDRGYPDANQVLGR